MGKGLEFVISALDYATGPFKKVANAIEHTSSKFEKLKVEADKLNHPIDSIRDGFNMLEKERGTTTSRKRLEELNTQIKGLGKTIHKLENLPPEGFFKRLRSASGVIGQFGPLIAGAFSVSALTSFGQSVLETTAKYQKFEAVLTTQLQSAASGKQAMEMIQKFAAETPFAVDEITESFTKLASQGFEPTKAQLTNLGDLAASMGKPFDQLTEAVLDAQTGEFERLKEFGIKAKKHGDTINMTFKGQTTAIGTSSKAMQEYLLGIGKAPGVIGSMAAISATTGDKLSNLGDSVDNLKKGLGDALKPTIDAIIDKLKWFVEKLQAVGAWMKEHPKFITMFATGLGIAAVALAGLTFGMWLFNAAMWANPITWVVVGILLLAGTIAYLITYFDGWGKAWNSLITYFKMSWKEFKETFNIVWLAIKDGFLGGIESMMSAWYKLKSLWDEDGANAGLNKIQQQQDARALELAESKGKLVEYHNQKNAAWDGIFTSITKSKDEKAKEDPVAAAVKKLNGGSAAGADGKGDKKHDKGKEMSSKVNSGGSRPTTINLTIHKLQDQITIHTTNLQTGAKEAGRQIVEEILMALNSVNGKAQAAV